MGTRWGENNPEDHVRYARIDLLGLVREDLLFDMARHVDSTVHQFEEWGLPLMKNEKTGTYLREELCVFPMLQCMQRLRLWSSLDLTSRYFEVPLR